MRVTSMVAIKCFPDLAVPDSIFWKCFVHSSTQLYSRTSPRIDILRMWTSSHGLQTHERLTELCVCMTNIVDNALVGLGLKRRTGASPLEIFVVHLIDSSFVLMIEHDVVHVIWNKSNYSPSGISWKIDCCLLVFPVKHFSIFNTTVTTDLFNIASHFCRLVRKNICRNGVSLMERKITWFNCRASLGLFYVGIVRQSSLFVLCFLAEFPFCNSFSSILEWLHIYIQFSLLLFSMFSRFKIFPSISPALQIFIVVFLQMKVPLLWAKLAPWKLFVQMVMFHLLVLLEIAVLIPFQGVL